MVAHEGTGEEARARRVTLGTKAPHSKGDLSPMTEKTQKSKVVVLVKHHAHTHSPTHTVVGL